MSVTIEQVRSALATVQNEGQDIVARGMVSGLSVNQGQVFFALEVDPRQGSALEPLRQAAQAAVEKIPGVVSVSAVLTAEKSLPSVKTPQPSFSHKISSRPVAPHVKRMIAVASGKGGVGKSTVTANLAAALAAQGLRIGLLDADIYGASQPRMMGHRQRPEVNAEGLIEPPMVHGIKMISMGFFVDPEAPMIWRGPMVHSAIQQLLRDVAWGSLDILLIDLPPGTGDAQLSLSQNVPLAGAIIVSTPQDVALAEAKKGLAMFQKLGVPILGLIENMSYHACRQCGHEEHIFGHGGVKAESARLNLPFLGAVPLHIAVRTAADAGMPIVLADPDHAAARVFSKMAEDLL